MEDFASTALFNLIVEGLRRQGLTVNQSQRFEGKTERISKKKILDRALDELGPAAILKIGAGIRASQPSPMARVLSNSVSVPDLIERWQRLEVFFHGNHRVQSVESSAMTATLSHYALQGPGPTEGEDLVVAGLFAALFQLIGVRGLNLYIGDQAVIVNDSIIENVTRSKATRCWKFGWSCFERATPDATLLTTEGDIVERVKLLIQSDIGRSWKLASVAQILAVSVRTLQRRLSNSGTSFQSLLRSTRADAAAVMLLERRAELLETGYATGFSDQAHFSREFKLRFNMSPSDYLALNM